VDFSGASANSYDLS